ncbi:hypothetical protein BYT27DRAFT_6432092 [Phlegmacium glaucopus]|nr:hypothetical protein BYT27DRAFT_7317419 [Phlegmacium glaucopus]KAF8812074.1 hypothetical protein BYT27DRAFT_6432092 [Phlegmacium glaucopus]
MFMARSVLASIFSSSPSLKAHFGSISRSILISCGFTAQRGQETRYLERMKTNRLAATIACQIAISFPVRPRLIMIHGLDKCQDARAQTSIIHFFSQLILHQKLPFAVLFASCVEYHLQSALQDDQFKNSLLSIPLDNVYCPDADIREFIAI